MKFLHGLESFKSINFKLDIYFHGIIKITCEKNSISLSHYRKHSYEKKIYNPKMKTTQTCFLKMGLGIFVTVFDKSCIFIIR